MVDFLTALGLAIAMEGVAWALFPASMKKMMLQILAQPVSHVRGAGLTAAIVGVGVLWLIRG